MNMGKNKILIGLAILGLVVGFGVMRLWRSADTVPAAQGNAAGPSTAAPATTGFETPAPRGSSLSVVGGMSREELTRRGVEVPPAPVAPSSSTPPQAGAPGSPGAPEDVPASVQFPPAVAQAASNFMCLCGCGHHLGECPCNDQPIGAVTMLSHLQKLMSTETDPAALSLAMVDRYGDAVLVAPSQP
jgi:hypothetical protein